MQFHEVLIVRVDLGSSTCIALIFCHIAIELVIDRTASDLPLADGLGTVLGRKQMNYFILFQFQFVAVILGREGQDGNN